MKHLLLLGTGGTIACKRGENGLTPLLTGDELLSYVPDAKKFCEVETVQVLNIDSTNMHPKHWLKLAQVLEENYDDYDGFVICHGHRYDGLHRCCHVLSRPALQQAHRHHRCPEAHRP